MTTPWTVQIADAEKAVQTMPESADAWYYLGDALFHFGLLSDVPDPQVRARRAFEQAFQRDSLYGAPVQHLAALTFVAGDTAAQRLWTKRWVSARRVVRGCLQRPLAAPRRYARREGRDGLARRYRHHAGDEAGLASSVH